MLLRMLEAIPRPVVLLGVIITLLLLIYPDFLIGLFHPSADIREASIRALAGFNAFLLALFSMAGAASFFSPRVPQLKGSLSHPPDVGIGYHEPQKTLLILATLPNFPNSKDILPFLHRACLLANLLPRRIETLDESFALLPHGDILGIISDSAYYDNIFPHVRRTGAILFGLSQAKEFRRTGAGNRIDISLPEAPTEVMLPDFSSVLTAVFSKFLDT